MMGTRSCILAPGSFVPSVVYFLRAGQSCTCESLLWNRQTLHAPVMEQLLSDRRTTVTPLVEHDEDHAIWVSG